MEIIKRSSKRLEITQELEIDQKSLFDYISKPHKMSLWLADNVRKTSKGFELRIVLPLHEIRNEATIVTREPPQKFEFIWNSEFVMNTSVVTLKIIKNNKSSILEISEVGGFDESRWSDPQSIHIDLWEKALNRLKEVIT